MNNLEISFIVENSNLGLKRIVVNLHSFESAQEEFGKLQRWYEKHLAIEEAESKEVEVPF